MQSRVNIPALRRLGLLIAFFLTIHSASAQNRRVFVEEFTGTWCHYCTSGDYAMDQLALRYPGRVALVQIHGGLWDPMQSRQGDSIINGIGLAVSEAGSCPVAWLARTFQPENFVHPWNVTPIFMTQPLDGFTSSTSPGYVDTMVKDPALATVAFDSIAYDTSSPHITATVSTIFKTGMMGDFRLNIIVTEDSVHGDNSPYDQYNFWYHRLTPTNPFDTMGTPQKNGESIIHGFMHMRVYRESVAGVLGVKGAIPNNPAVGKKYSQTFTFDLPATIMDPQHAHLIAIVQRFSSTDTLGNEVYDAEDVMLHPKTSYTGPHTISFGKIKAGTDSSTTISVLNTGGANEWVTGSIAGNGFSFKHSPMLIEGKTTGIISITFSPKDTGRYSGMLIFSGSDAPEISDTVFLSGTGINSRLAFDRDTIDFGDVNVGATSKATLAMTNSGAVTLKIFRYHITSGTPVFGVSDSATHSLAIQALGYTTLSFHPNAVGSFTGSLIISTDEANTPTRSIVLVGRGVQGSLMADPDFVEFGNLAVGLESTIHVTIVNTGTAPAIINSLVLTGSTDFHYSALKLPLSLASGDSTALDISYVPLTSGSKQATLKFEMTDHTTFNLSLHGSGISGFGSVGNSTSKPSAFSVQVEPNPSSGSCELEFTSATSGIIDIKLFDLLGRELRSIRSPISGSGLNRIPLIIEDLPNGTYVLRAFDSQGHSAQTKLVIEH